MAWVIKDTLTNEYYRQRAGDGWYSTDINAARIYTTKSQAEKTISEGNHHITYPGNRILNVIEIVISEKL